MKFKTIQIDVFKECGTDGKPVYEKKPMNIIDGLDENEILKFKELAELKGAAQCSSDCACIPESQRLRREAHCPQAVYQFAEVDDDGKIVGAPKYPITIPHHVAEKPETGLPNFKRGNWELIYVLSDGSRVTLHAFDEENANLILDAIKQRIIPTYLEGAYLSKNSEVNTNVEIQEIDVKNRLAKYWSQGTKKEKPDWIAKW